MPFQIEPNEGSLNTEDKYTAFLFFFFEPFLWIVCIFKVLMLDLIVRNQSRREYWVLLVLALFDMFLFCNYFVCSI